MSVISVIIAIISVFFVSLASTYFYYVRKFEYWKKKGVKYPEPKFFYGSMKETFRLKKYVGDLYEEIYRSFPDEKVVGTYRGAIPTLLIRDPDIAKNILVKDFASFHDRGTDRNTKNDILSRNLSHIEGEEWRLLRQKLTPTFTSSKVKNMFSLMTQCGDNFVTYLSSLDSDVEARQIVTKFTMEAIGACAFGVDFSTMADSNSPFASISEELFKSRPFKMFLQNMLPTINKLLRITFLPKEVQTFFISFVKKIVEEHKTRKERRHDYMDLLIDLRDSGKILNGSKIENIDLEMTDEFLTAQVFTFFVGGFETSATALSFTLHELAHNVDVQNKAYKDIVDVLAKHNNVFTYDALQDMKYIKMVLDESLRKYPPAGLHLRRCNKKYYISECDLEISVRDYVVISVQGMCHDPKYFPEPHRFIPERFTDDECLNRHPFAYTPFGEGPRHCIGQRFANLQSMVGLVTLLRKFKVEPTARTPRNLKMNPRSRLASADGGIWIKLLKRS